MRYWFDLPSPNCFSSEFVARQECLPVGKSLELKTYAEKFLTLNS